MEPSVDTLKKYISEPYRKEFYKLIGSIYHPAVITTYNYINPVILYSNVLHEELTEWRFEDILFKSPKTFQPEDMDIEIRREMKVSLKEKRFFNGNLRNLTKTGKEYNININIIGIMCKFDDGCEESFYVALKNVI